MLAGWQKHMVRLCLRRKGRRSPRSYSRLKQSSSFDDLELFGKGQVPMNFDLSLHTLKIEMTPLVGMAIEFFDQTPVRDLLVPRFAGTGVYALYYLGEHELYLPLTALNQEKCTHPIYVGKAVPTGRRTGRTMGSQGTQLYSRLRQHSNSITHASDLGIDDFRCRFMILSDAMTDLIVPVESELVRRYSPLWNSRIDGFGNHDPGSGRYDQAPSEWDTVHPGRPWVERLRGEPPSLEVVKAKARASLRELS